MTDPTPDAVVLLSGGQDSTTCLAWAQSRWETVLAVSFDYGQRHVVELACAQDVAKARDVEHVILSLGTAFARIGGASLTDPDVTTSADAAGTGNAYAAKHGLPSSFVPGRNAVLLALAAGLAATRGAPNIVTGVCQEDDAGYPDCRATFIGAQESALQLALDWPELRLHVPLMWRSKAQTWQLAADLGAVALVRDLSHTCYEGDHDTRHEWGYGCGNCPACDTRAAGYAEWKRDSAAAQPA